MSRQAAPLTADGRTFSGTFVSMGNPHFVIFVSDIDTLDIARYGTLLERDRAFPERCNIEFAQPAAYGTIRTRVWGAAAASPWHAAQAPAPTAVAAAVTGRAPRHSDIAMDGGTLHIEWNEADGHVYMTGPTAFAFEGEVLLP